MANSLHWHALFILVHTSKLGINVTAIDTLQFNEVEWYIMEINDQIKYISSRNTMICMGICYSCFRKQYLIHLKCHV